MEDFERFPSGAEFKSSIIQGWLQKLGLRQNIDLLQELTSVDNADEVAIFDASETGQNKTKKITVANLLSGGGIAGPGSSTDNAVARWDGTGGDTLQDSAFIVDNSGHVTSFGGQIKFPATQAASSDANTLDDYEEGTWTPTVTAASGSFTTVSATGAYTKIGRVVCVNFDISITTNGTAAGSINITLPFTSGSNSAGAARERAVTGNMCMVTVTASSGNASIVTYNNLYPGGDGHNIRGSATYFV